MSRPRRLVVLLPPSERKAPAVRGRPVDLTQLVGAPGLTAAREEVLHALAAVSSGADAPRALGLPPSLHEEIRRNVDWRSAPSRRGGELYTGVLYDALGLGSLDPGARRRASTRLLIQSAAYGVLRPTDRVAAYRASMSMRVPGIGQLAAYWRPHLAPVMDALVDGALVVDCRSADYAAAWRPGPEQRPRTVTVRVQREMPDGGRSVVSHLAKHTRGEVTRHLLTRDGAEPRTPEALAEAVAERWPVELLPPARDGSRQIDVVTTG